MSELSRRQFLGTAGAAKLGVAASGRPNIVFLFSDDHHFQCLGAAGNPHIRTPNLDRLANRGIYFRNGIASTPQCCPSRGVVLSGLESYQNGILSNGARNFRPGVGPTVVEQLRRASYDTVLVGKWHIEPPPEQCGFLHAPLWLRGGGSRYIDPQLRRGLEGSEETVPGHITDLLTDAALDYVAGAKQPFLLWLAYNAPHTPWHAAPKHRAPYENKPAGELAPPRHPPGGAPFDWITYYAVITHLDEAVGRIIAGLEKAGLWGNTAVFFAGDNGYTCGTRGWTGKVHPWEESIRVPFIAAGGLVEPGKIVDEPVATVDLPATWLDLAQVKPAYRLAGRSLKPFFTRGRERREAAFAAWDDGRPEALAVRRAIEPYRLVRTERYKYVLRESGSEELFDCENDPAEQRTLIDENSHQGVARKLRALLRKRLAETEDRAIRWIG